MAPKCYARHRARHESFPHTFALTLAHTLASQVLRAAVGVIRLSSP